MTSEHSSSDAATEAKLSAEAVANYFPRRLRTVDDNLPSEEVDEARVVATDGPRIILGEPGMGKTELMRELARRLNVQPISALRFMHNKHPAALVVPDKPLLIDALDEAISRREGDAVDEILAKLEHAGSPDFIMSCRSREWQARNVTNLRQIYGNDPTIFALEPFDRDDAHKFLLQRFGKADAKHVLDHLEKHNLTDLYHNPLTLGLMGRVAEHDAQLPSTKAQLFERVCKLIWPEHDPDRQDSGLAKLSEDDALAAAGAIMTALLLMGSEAVSVAGPSQFQEGDVRLADLRELPDGEATQAVLSSKLFHSVGIGRAKPLHRVIAEFLGARWLAQQTKTPRQRRRLLGQLHGGGAVPASLRGLHAWLAFHSPLLAKGVIAADPLGVLRYGDAASLTPDQAQWMFDALLALAETDPYFRGQDWDSHTAAGLMIPSLRTKIQGIVESSASNEHLRSLLVEGVKDTPLASELSSVLETILLSNERFYREREAAAEALLPIRDRAWWGQTIDALRGQGTEDATRLSRNLIETIEYDVSDELLVSTMFAEMGVTISPLPRQDDNRRHTIRSYRGITGGLPTSRLASVLNLVSDFAALVSDTEREIERDIAEIMSSLMSRAIVEKAVDASTVGALWRWLGATQRYEPFKREEQKSLKQLLHEQDDLRRAIQHYAIFVQRPRPSIWESAIDLERRMVGLYGRPSDIIPLVEHLASADNKLPRLREDWRDLMRLGIDPRGADPLLLAASQKFQRGDRELGAFLHGLQNPKKQPWQIKHERQAAKYKEEKQRRFEEDRSRYLARRSAVRAGDLQVIVYLARVYLGHSRDHPDMAEWLGGELVGDVMTGFEAVLRRSDLPTPADVATSFAEGKTWNYCYAIMAGLLARHHANKDFADLSAEVRTVGLLLCHNDHGMSDGAAVPALREALEATLMHTREDLENFARLWIEPSLEAGKSHVTGLYLLAHNERWQATGASLAAEWLVRFANVPESVELELIDCLTHPGTLSKLAPVASARATTVFRSFEHLLTWLAVDVLARFDAVRPVLGNIGAQNPEFVRYLQNRFRGGPGNRMMSTTVAQAEWIISEFRAHSPDVDFFSTDPDDDGARAAARFLRALIDRLANDASLEAGSAMETLLAAPKDSYTDLIRHMAAEQRQKRAEEHFSPLRPRALSELLSEGPPANIDDLRSLVLEEIAVAQKKLVGTDLDEIRDFWSDDGIPYDENRCRDRLAAMIGPELYRYQVQRITEADMPLNKRADLAFSHGDLQLPMEVKGQWHPDVWDAATGQLDAQYLIDWRSQQRGTYCVLWFGDVPQNSGRRLKAPPVGLTTPQTAEAMREMLVGRIPETRRMQIDVVVLDLSAGKPKAKATPKRSKGRTRSANP